MPAIRCSRTSSARLPPVSRCRPESSSQIATPSATSRSKVSVVILLPACVCSGSTPEGSRPGPPAARTAIVFRDHRPPVRTPLGLLVGAHNRARQQGGKLRLVCPEGRVLRLLRLTELPVHHTLREGLADEVPVPVTERPAGGVAYRAGG
jgi:hypothetical protein